MISIVIVWAVSFAIFLNVGLTLQGGISRGGAGPTDQSTRTVFHVEDRNVTFPLPHFPGSTRRTNVACYIRHFFLLCYI